MTPAQSALPFESPTAIVETQFLRFLETADGIKLRAECIARARRLRAKGWKHFSIDALFHSVRFDRSVDIGPDEDGFRINDHHSSHMARHIMASCPDLEGFFETRQLRGRAWRKKRAA